MNPFSLEVLNVVYGIPGRLSALKSRCGRRFWALAVAILFGGGMSERSALAAESAGLGRPNILLILADDMGFSDAGCYGGEIATPNLDALAKGGIRFTQFYNTARCWPSRAALMTGYYAQQVRRDTVPGIKSGTLGSRPRWAPLLSTMLQSAGYRCYHSGKWHLDGKPMSNGFHRSYSLNDHDRHFAPKLHTEDDVELAAVKTEEDYYSSTAIASHAIKSLKEHERDHGTKPFFQYLAFTAPHFPLQARPEDIERYRGVYEQGWDLLREKRLKRLQELGIATGLPSVVERDLGPPYDFPDAIRRLGSNEVNRAVAWGELTVAQRRFQAAKMAVHAAMVDRMDREIGRVLEQIRAMGKWDNTLVMFLSDNGASAEMMVRGDGHDPDAQCGTGATFLSIGPGWSSLANTPFRRHKTWVHEGGISTPCIVQWPKGIAARGELRHAPAHLIDVVPTMLDLLGANTPQGFGMGQAPRRPGVSLAGVLARNEPLRRSSLWWLHEGNRSLRVGSWKIVASGAKSTWELYDLETDRGETKNRAAERPELVRDMGEQWQRMTEAHAAEAGRVEGAGAVR